MPLMRSKYKDEWLRAMESEMKSLEDHRTWKLVDMPSDKKAIGCKWVFRIKRDPSGKIIKFKARLEAKGFTQRPGSINTAVAIAAEEDMEAENVDVDTAFLYGDVEEELYMDQPDGFEDQVNPTKKCLLMQVLYGTKQAARQWNSKLNKHLEGQGFHRSAADPCVYVRRSDSKFSIIIVYVDDIMIFSRTKAEIGEIKKALKREFSIKELGELKYCLGIEIHRNRDDKTIVWVQGVGACACLYACAGGFVAASSAHDETRRLRARENKRVGACPSAQAAWTCASPDNPTPKTKNRAGPITPHTTEDTPA
uniref:Reverse transcriptase Ty1/copia-type domain-containing protein n=1 Tax=Phytophthora ramorum TaxID=164328 RepID=H3H6A2_PHYRM